MAAKKISSDTKRRPSVLTKTISFGEERNGATRVTRPGASPTTPKGRKYPSTPPPHPRKIEKAKARKGSITATSALAVKIRKLANGSLAFTEPGGRKFTNIVPLDDQVVVDTPTISSPTGGFKNTPSILHGGIDFWKNGNFKFANTSGWKCVSKQDKPSGHEEEWIYVGEDSPPTTPKGKKTPASPKSPPPAPKKTQKYIDFGGGDDLTNWAKIYAQQQGHYYPPPDPRLDPGFNPHTGKILSKEAQKLRDLSHPTGPRPKDPIDWEAYYSLVGHDYPNLMEANTLEEAAAKGTWTKDKKTAAVPTKKARKNKKAREKKAVVKKNLGKRQKLPYVPKEVLGKEGRVTRSKKVTQFFALP